MKRKINELFILVAVVLILGNCNNKNLKDSKFFNVINENTTLMFIGAHPDDETVVGPLLAYCSDVCKDVYVVSATRGRSGWNLHKEDLSRTLAEVREEEFKAALKILGCQPIVLNYVNGCGQSHPQGLAILDKEQSAFKRWKTAGDATETIEQAWARWTKIGGEPNKRLLTLFLKKKPDVIITFGHEGWATGPHREHVLVYRATKIAVKEYNKTVQQKISLFYFYPQKGMASDLELIIASKLNNIGSKDYLKIAKNSKACYETQYGTKGSKRNRRWINKIKKKFFLKFSE